MAKSRSSKKNFLSKSVKSIKNTSKKVIPVVSSGLKTVGKVAEKSVPVVEKGISGVYGALATGFDMGVKGVKKGVTMMSKKRHTSSKKRHHKKTHKKRHYKM